jgi:hypothetical protein
MPKKWGSLTEQTEIGFPRNVSPREAGAGAKYHDIEGPNV